MVDLKEARSAPEKQLFKEMERVHAGMLGLENSHDHMQPMAHRVDADRKRIYFFTKTDTDLVKQVGPSARAHFCVVGKDHDYHACIAGTLSPTRSREIIDRHWGPVVSAWYDKGKDDPSLIVLEFTPETAGIWASTDSALRFGWEIAKANLTDSEPDVGVKTEVRF
jgi:general stress protein 26